MVARRIRIGSAAAYVGPGDVVGSALAWWGVRAYSTATIGANAIRIYRVSDTTEQDFVTLSTGELDYASIATFLAATSGKVRTLYDQTGNGRHLTNAGVFSTLPAYNASGPNSKAKLDFTASSTQTLKYTTTITQSQPTTMVAVANRATSGSNQNLIMAGASSQQLGYDSTAHLAKMYAGSAFTATANDATWHCLQAIFNGASSNLRVDATDNTGDAFTQSVGSAGLYLGATDSGAQPFDGAFTEGGFWGSAFNGTQLTNMDANISSYYSI